MNACVVIPTKNQAHSLKSLALNEDFDVYIADDCSDDDTTKIALYNGYHVIRNKEPKSYAATLLKGFKLALNLEYDFYFTFNPSIHNYEQIFSMSKLCYQSDMIIGSRFLPFSFYEVGFSKHLHKLANQCFSVVGMENYDYLSSFRCYRTDLLQSLLKHNYYSHDEYLHAEMLMKSISLGATINEYPIVSKRQKQPFISGFKTLWHTMNTHKGRPEVYQKDDFWS